MLIEKHASWLAVNNVVGCPNNCKYCFLGVNKGIKPIEKASPKKAIEALLESPLYKSDIPVALMVNTDAFSTPTNKQALFALLDECVSKHLPNLFVIVTKREITEKDCMRLKTSIAKGLNLLVYVSYSGLKSEFEKGIRKNGKLEALTTIDNLFDAKIPCAHYWRPLIKQNTSKETIHEVFNNVYNKCIGSVVTGLKLYPSMSCQDYWPEAQRQYNLNPNSECIFPKGALESIFKLAKPLKYPVFVDNVCLLAMVEEKPCIHGIYKSNRCIHYNKCSTLQRCRCSNHYCADFPHVSEKQHSAFFVSDIEKNNDKTYWGNSFTSTHWDEI